MKIGKKWQLEIGKNTITVETGKFCALSNGNCIISCGETKVMVNVTMANKTREGIDFFPLGVDFEEKMYAVGKIPGGYRKREGRASDKGILAARLIDRQIRPLFPKGFYNDVSIVATALSIDPEIAPEPLAMFGASVALALSDVPFDGPIGSVCVGLINGEYVVNPTNSELDNSKMDTKVAGTKDAVLMVESGAKEVTEGEMLGAITFAHKYIKEMVEFQLKIREELGVKVNSKVELRNVPEEMRNEIISFSKESLEKVFMEFDKFKRNELESETDKIIYDHFEELYPEQRYLVAEVLYNMKKEIVRTKIVQKGVRPDGRSLKEIRPIWCEVGTLPRVHGSGVFTRGITQVLTTLTLGTMKEAQELDGIDDEFQKRYMHQYNMPPYSTGEAKNLRSPGRREIGHGALAERALEPVLPSEKEFPYAIRTVSEVLSSNGSTSQASVCASSLALMDGGVPIKSAVAGIAMGLIKDKETGKVFVLSDIQGVEDFFGDMDFKVAGTEKGITAIQMDMKIKGIDDDILRTALAQAKDGRQHILNEMNKVLNAPRQQLSKYAPKIITFAINPDKIREVIGSGGKVINKIIDDTGVKIDISDEGLVSIAGENSEMTTKAKNIIMGIVEEIELGKTYIGTVVKTLPFGAFVDVLHGKEGMIHISKLSDKQVATVEEIVRTGDKVEVDVIKIDEKGRVNLKLNKIILNK